MQLKILNNEPNGRIKYLFKFLVGKQINLFYTTGNFEYATKLLNLPATANVEYVIKLTIGEPTNFEYATKWIHFVPVQIFGRQKNPYIYAFSNFLGMQPN